MDWKRTKAEYIAGGISYRKLAEKYGVSFNTLKTRAKEEQWYQLRQQKEHRTTTKIVESLSDKDAEKAVDIIDVANKLLKKIEEIIDHVDFPTGIKDISTALKNIKDIKGFKTDADAREQEARIRNLERQAEAESTDNEIKVIIEGNLDKYST